MTEQDFEHYTEMNIIASIDAPDIPVTQVDAPCITNKMGTQKDNINVWWLY